MEAMKLNTRKYTYKNVSPAQMVMALDGLTLEQARVYAAAPELLEALKNMHAKALKGQLKTLGDLNEAEDAIRAATGKTYYEL